MNVLQALTSQKHKHIVAATSAAHTPKIAPEQAISVSVTQCLERLTGHQKVPGSVPVRGSEIVFLRFELDRHHLR